MLVSMKEILDRARSEGYAVAAPNVDSEMDARAYIVAAEELDAPLVLDVGYGMHPDVYMLGQILRALAQQSRVPIAINLDHATTLDEIIAAIQAGFTSVMIDGSRLSFDENVALTQQVVRLAHTVGVSVEGELGHVGEAANYAVDRDAALTGVDDAVRFVEATGVDCLAVAIGTAHGPYPAGFEPFLDFERLAELSETAGVPLVLHGSSGTGADDLRRACASGINKVNVASDLYRAAADAVTNADLTGRGSFALLPTAMDAAKARLQELIGLYGSAGRAWQSVPPGLATAPVSAAQFKKTKGA